MSSTPKLLVVFGATGLQGGGVIEKLLGNPLYKIRGVTRKADSAEAKALSAKGVEVVEADLNNYDSVLKSIEGAQAIFGNTIFPHLTPFDSQRSLEIEIHQGKNLANAAAATPSLEHYIWSTLPVYPLHNEGLNGAKTPHFLSKVTIDEYILSLPELAKKTSFMLLPYYVMNLAQIIPIKKRVADNGEVSYVWAQPCPPTTYMPLTGDVRQNAGVWAAKILERPDLCLPAKYVLSNESVWRVDELIAAWSRIMGKKAVFEQISLQEFVDTHPWGKDFGREMGLMMVQFGEYSDPTKPASSFNKPGYEKNQVTRQQLGVNDLIGIEETMKGLDWSHVL